MKSIDTSGKTVEDAIKVGLKELNCDLADVTIDVLDAGSPGLFGMFGRLAKVRLTAKEEEGLGIEMPVFSLDAVDEKKPKPAPARENKPKERLAQPKEKPAPKPAQAPPIEAAAEPVQIQPRAEEPRAQRPRQAANPARAPKPVKLAEPRAPKLQSAPKRHDPAPIKVEAKDLPPLDEAALQDEGRTALEFLRNVTNMMGVDVEIRIQQTEEQLDVQMIGDSLGVLIGRRGDTLDALQYLTSLQVNKNQGKYVRVTLDTEHYRAKRAEALNKLASRMAARVHKTGHRVALEPMNPYERRILHSALQNHPYVTTHSEGDEPYRRVIITLK